MSREQQPDDDRERRPGRESRSDSDDTVAATSRVDETVVVPRPDAPDETVMVERPQAAEDTVMVDRAAMPVSDETIVSPRAPATPEAAPSPASQETRETSQSLSGSVAPPVQEPQTGSASRQPRRIRHDNLDPMRRIAPAPWKATTSAEPGVRPGLPVTYGPRYDSVDGLQADLDEVHRRIGPVPLTAPAPPPADRSALPSMRKRARRRSIVTIVTYTGVVVLCAGGLITVWQLAFG